MAKDTLDAPVETVATETTDCTCANGYCQNCGKTN